MFPAIIFAPPESLPLSPLLFFFFLSLLVSSRLGTSLLFSFAVFGCRSALLRVLPGTRVVLLQFTLYYLFFSLLVPLLRSHPISFSLFSPPMDGGSLYLPRVSQVLSPLRKRPEVSHPVPFLPQPHLTFLFPLFPPSQGHFCVKNFLSSPPQHPGNLLFFSLFSNSSTSPMSRPMLIPLFFCRTFFFPPLFPITPSRPTSFFRFSPTDGIVD